MTHSPSQSMFRELLTALGEAADRLVADADPRLAATAGADAHRYLLHVLSCGIEFHVEPDPERPYFTRVITPTRKMLGDNPDAIYQKAAIRGDRSYRIRGSLGGADYMSLTIHGRDPSGGVHERVIADINHHALDIRPDGTFEVLLSSDKYPGNWIRLEPDAGTIVSRHYFRRTIPAAADPFVSVPLAIEPLTDPGPRAPLTDHDFAERLRTLTTYIRAQIPVRTERPPLPAFVSDTPNVLPPPLNFRQSQEEMWGAVDIHYSMGRYELAPDEALVIEGRMPRGSFANVMLWNQHTQTLDYRTRTVSLNDQQMVTAPDGSFRVVIAHRDPGTPNWLDTEGRPTAEIAWRFLESEQPGPLICRVVAHTDLTDAP
ncbi:DUF1214 domain-containing protein [Yinghuangia aomiensis]